MMLVALRKEDQIETGNTATQHSNYKKWDMRFSVDIAYIPLSHFD